MVVESLPVWRDSHDSVSSVEFDDARAARELPLPQRDVGFNGLCSNAEKAGGHFPTIVAHASFRLSCRKTL
jgi:hypothetical protein